MVARCIQGGIGAHTPHPKFPKKRFLKRRKKTEEYRGKVVKILFLFNLEQLILLFGRGHYNSDLEGIRGEGVVG